jgi:hypothetical protein
LKTGYDCDAGLNRIHIEEVAVYKQSLIPGFPEGAQRVGQALSILKQDGWVTYFVGGDNYFDHKESDKAGERFAFACLMENGHVRATDLQKPPLLLPHRTLMNWCAQYRKEGGASFFRGRPLKTPPVMTEAVRAQCASLLEQGLKPAEVARRVGIEHSTLRKAITRKAIPMAGNTGAPDVTPGQASAVQVQPIPASTKSASTKSARSQTDAQAAHAMGTACTRADERVEAAFGLATSASTRFEHVCDVPMGGLLAGLPALCANGLLSGLDKYLSLPKGFYSALHILMTLAFMALGRIRRPEGLRHIAPGEFGKVIGLDRVPEVRTLREKTGLLAATGQIQAWMQDLSKRWMQDDPAEAGYLYVDGHVRVYDGEVANLPKRFVSRERLCLRGTTDYWVNDALGRPFFVISKALTEGMGEALLHDIVPELLASVPQQPTQQELDDDPLLHRFVIVFDRECSNYKLISQLWALRIGAITYRKNVKDKWPVAEFVEQEVPVLGGDSTKMKLAMRESTLGSGKELIGVTEVRRLTDTGHQTAIITSAKKLGNTTIASRMFARWCQENFFAYMMQHYDIDGLIEYGAQELPGTTLVVNPKYRQLEKAIKHKRLTEKNHQARLAQYTLKEAGDGVQKKAECVESIQALQTELAVLRASRKDTPKKVKIESLPIEQRPTELLPLSKQLADTVKMIAYRAETAMVAMLRKHLNKEDEARALVRALFVSSGDIEPDEQANTLTIKIHRMATPAHDKALELLLADLTDHAFCHPETTAKMIFRLV